MLEIWKNCYFRVQLFLSFSQGIILLAVNYRKKFAAAITVFGFQRERPNGKCLTYCVCVDRVLRPLTSIIMRVQEFCVQLMSHEGEEM
jgi:hypothetical protein